MKLNLLLWLCFFGIIVISIAKKSDESNKPSWAKKDIRDYNDADLERLLDQWEVMCKQKEKIDRCTLQTEL